MKCANRKQPADERRGAISDEYPPEPRTERDIQVDCGGPARYAAEPYRGQKAEPSAKQGGTAVNIALEPIPGSRAFLLKSIMKGIQNNDNLRRAGRQRSYRSGN